VLERRTTTRDESRYGGSSLFASAGLFLARFDTKASWPTDLEPAFGARDFFLAEALREVKRLRRQRSSRTEALGSLVTSSGREIELAKRPTLFETAGQWQDATPAPPN
jgi:hypothetical protein